jgi:hypothetical protein
LEKSMKKYVSLAAILGAIACVSVSLPAQAQPSDAPATAPPVIAVPEANTYAKDRAECDALVSAPTTEGAAPSEGDKTAALTRCLTVKGHSADEIKKEEAAKATPAPPAASTDPAAH